MKTKIHANWWWFVGANCGFSLSYAVPIGMRNLNNEIDPKILHRDWFERVLDSTRWLAIIKFGYQHPLTDEINWFEIQTWIRKQSFDFNQFFFSAELRRYQWLVYSLSCECIIAGELVHALVISVIPHDFSTW